MRSVLEQAKPLASARLRASRTRAITCNRRVAAATRRVYCFVEFDPDWPTRLDDKFSPLVLLTAACCAIVVK